MTSPRSTTLACLTLLAVASPASAGEWKHEVAPYLWGAALDGSVGIGGISADADLSFSDILDNLEMGFMGAYRATRDRYSITMDVVYMGLGATGHGPGGLLKADVDVDQLGLSADVGYAATERFTVYGGLRYVALDSTVKLTGPQGGTQSADTDEDWVDPYVGARYTIPFSDIWSANLQGDIGGFGVGSDFTWQAIASVRWRITPRTGMAMAYRYLDMDYENGNGSNAFKYDMANSGPALGVVFTF